MHTSSDTVTIAQILTLRDEAENADDIRMVRLCDLALDGDEDAIGKCAAVIADAEAMGE
jgi:hypothetical protein